MHTDQQKGLIRTLDRVESMVPRENGIETEYAEPRIYLSPPHMGEAELELVREAFASNRIAPVGPHLDAFEKELAHYIGVSDGVALSSGTAAIHLALRLLGVRRGDEVFCSMLTFVASANPIVYKGAIPVFIDAKPTSWNMDPELLVAELDACASQLARVRANANAGNHGRPTERSQLLGPTLQKS